MFDAVRATVLALPLRRALSAAPIRAGDRVLPDPGLGRDEGG